MKKQPSISSSLFRMLFLTGFVALLIAGSSIYHEVEELITENLDQTLRADIEVFHGLIEVEHGKIELEYNDPPSGNFSIPHSGHYYQILLDGKIIARSNSLMTEQLILAPQMMVAEDPATQLKTYKTIGPALHPLRILEKTASVAGHPVQILIARSLTENLEMLHSLRNFLSLIGLLFTLLMAVLGWAISRQALKPLREFSAKVDQIGGATLDQRIDVDNQYLELGSLARAFNAMLERLQRSFQRHEALLSDVSHELKTPVTVIRSYCDIYLQKERPAAEYIESLQVIKETAESMGHKIRRLLGFAQSEADLIRDTGRQLVPVDDCLHKACLTLMPLAHERQIKIVESLATNLKVTGHSERLIEAFATLIENAVKYNKPQGSVEISVEQQQNQALIQIKDTGGGIPAEDIEHIFERFYRGQLSSNTEGAGLGLVLVKNIIEAHTGKIEVNSILGKGSCFTIWLPLV